MFAVTMAHIIAAAENDWQLKQELPVSDSSFKTSISQKYGFLDLHTGFFQHVEHTENEVNELGAAAESAGPSERRKARLLHEDEKWDDEYYMYVPLVPFITSHPQPGDRADYADDEYIQELIHWRHPHAVSQNEIEYSEEEKLTMLRLPRRECEHNHFTNSQHTDHIL